MLLTPACFQKKLLKWYDQFGRKGLPWQEDKTPYRVWISEIMLQQTQVRTAAPYFERFMARFPTVEELALADEDEVLSLWSGLGYYSRAHNIRKAALHIASLGRFPTTLEEWMGLPGIGRSTAGAVLAMGSEKRAPILDGNVKRVLCRLHAITEWPGDKKTNEQLWALAERYTPTRRVADYTQAIMDLGATLCLRRTPRCEDCPVAKYCRARQQGIEKDLPISKPTRVRPVKKMTFLILHHKNQVLLEKQAAKGIWAGLWSFPHTSGILSPEGLHSTCEERFATKIKEMTYGGPFRHTFTHFHLDILPVDIKIKNKIKPTPSQLWYALGAPSSIGLPAPVALLLEKRAL